MEKINLITSTQFDRYIETQKERSKLLKEIAESKTMGGTQIHKIDSWKMVQDIVRAGKTEEYFNIGDQFQFSHSRYGSKDSKILTCDIIGIDHDAPCGENGEEIDLIHSLTLQFHDVITPPAGMQLTGTKSDWVSSEMRRWLNTKEYIEGYGTNTTGLLNGFDSQLKEVMGTVRKSIIRGVDYNNAHVVIPEKIFFLSVNEANAHSRTYNNLEYSVKKSLDEVIDVNKKYCEINSDNVLTLVTLQPDDNRSPVALNWYEVKHTYDYYIEADNEKRKKNIIDTTSTGSWWFRTKSGTWNYSKIARDGGLSDDGVQTQNPIAPAFCIV